MKVSPSCFIRFLRFKIKYLDTASQVCNNSTLKTVDRKSQAVYGAPEYESCMEDELQVSECEDITSTNGRSSPISQTSALEKLKENCDENSHCSSPKLTRSSQKTSSSSIDVMSKMESPDIEKCAKSLEDIISFDQNSRQEICLKIQKGKHCSMTYWKHSFINISNMLPIEVQQTRVHIQPSRELVESSLYSMPVKAIEASIKSRRNKKDKSEFCVRRDVVHKAIFRAMRRHYFVKFEQRNTTNDINKETYKDLIVEYLQDIYPEYDTLPEIVSPNDGFSKEGLQLVLMTIVSQQLTKSWCYKMKNQSFNKYFTKVMSKYSYSM